MSREIPNLTLQELDEVNPVSGKALRFCIFQLMVKHFHRFSKFQRMGLEAAVEGIEEMFNTGELKIILDEKRKRCWFAMYNEKMNKYVDIY